jgi:tetratricopeptide (TPR) repeat protein
MTTRFLFALAAIAVLAGCIDKTPAPRVNELLRQKQLAQENAFLAYEDRDWKAAARNFQNTADILNAVDDYPGEAAARHNQARALQHAGQLDPAVAAYQRALTINRRLKRPAEEAMNLTGLAQCYAAQNKPGEAITAAEQALPNAGASKLIVQNDLASYLIQRNAPGDLDRAAKLLDTSDPKLAVTQLNLGRLSFVAGKPADAKPRLTQALEGFRAALDPAGIVACHDLLAKCCAALGESDAAEFHQQEARNKFLRLKIVPSNNRNKTGTSKK